jgi:hypothetical protein
VLKFAHVINTVSKHENAELFGIQQVTFNTLTKAREQTQNNDNIQHYSISFADGIEYLPTHFKQLPHLSRDIITLFPSNNKRLPFLSDIIRSAYQNIEAEYIIYSNLDIAIMPFFYEAIEAYLNQGYDALIINRRRIPDSLLQEPNLNLLYAEAGKIHTGYDCFVIKRDLIQNFISSDICIGIPGSGNDLFYNIFAFAENPNLFAHKHLTFHLGMELVKNWGSKELTAHNQREFYNLLDKLMPLMKADKFPGANLPFFERHYKWLMNPTLSYRHMFKLDMQRGFKKSAALILPYKSTSPLESKINGVSFDD